MHVGHFAVGMFAKKMEPKLSLGTCVLAGLLADFLVFALILAGIEKYQFLKEGRGAANYAVAINIAWSHGLLTGAVWAALFAGAFYAWRKNVRGAWILFAAVLSHWLLDFIAHRPDMPRSEEHTSELQSHSEISYAVFCLKKKK